MKRTVNFLRLFFLSFFVFSFIASTTVFALPEGQNLSSVPLPQSAIKNQAMINLNTADLQTLIQAHIKGIGKKRAEAIIAYRTQHGAFKSVDDLKNIKGISEKVINTNRNRLKI